jgi:hypothetical protein
MRNNLKDFIKAYKNEPKATLLLFSNFNLFRIRTMRSGGKGKPYF